MSGHPASGHPVGEDEVRRFFSQEAWEERYRSAGHSGGIWSGRPNPHLVTDAADLPAGTALDVACGEGADAVWLASRGWRVTAVDFSATALARAAEHARDAGDDVAARIDWVHADVTAWEPPAGGFDLVTSQYLHLPGGRLPAVVARLAAAVAAGGTLLAVGHHASDLATTVPRPDVPDMFFTAEDVAGTLDADLWQVQAGDARPRQVTDPHGRRVTIHDAVLRARRRP